MTGAVVVEKFAGRVDVVEHLIGAVGLTGLPVDTIDGSSLTDTVVQAVTAFSGLVAIFGRLWASKKIG